MKKIYLLQELEKKEEAQDDEKPGGTATEEGQEQEEEEDDYYEEEMEEVGNKVCKCIKDVTNHLWQRIFSSPQWNLRGL